jgi:hypothetical protein
MLRRFTILFILALLVLAVLPVSAGGNAGASFSLTCEGFSGSGSIALDRDNTGEAREAFIVSATDGSGKVIYEPQVDTFFVGGTVSWDGGDVIPWTATPQYNPLTLRVVSQAGNDFSEQLITAATGSCEGLPGYSALPEFIFEVRGDELVSDAGAVLPLGETSANVPINAEAPRPVNPDNLTETLAGYLLVNTDNLSLRSGDSVDYTLVAVVDGGTVLIPLGRNDDFTWWYVQAGEIIGWARAEFLIARGDLTGVGVVPVSGEITPPTFFVFSEQALLSAPRSNALPLCTLPGGLEYVIVGRDRPQDWYEVQVICDSTLVRGWLPATVGAVRNPAESFIPVTTP